MDIPESMRSALGAWNLGKGIDLETWIYHSGSFDLAVGYITVFCPEFVEFEQYILRGPELTAERIANLRGFEAQEHSTPQSVEWVLNHIHLADLHDGDEADCSPDKLLVLGRALKEIHEARLQYLFPHKPCVVDFHVPDDPTDVMEYQLSFWQQLHDPDYG